MRDLTSCKIHVTTEAYEKLAHMMENKKVNILAEFENISKAAPHEVSSHTHSHNIYICMCVCVCPFSDALLNVNGRTSGALENL